MGGICGEPNKACHREQTVCGGENAHCEVSPLDPSVSVYIFDMLFYFPIYVLTNVGQNFIYKLENNYQSEIAQNSG